MPTDLRRRNWCVSCVLLAAASIASASTPAPLALFDLQRRTFDFFWETTSPENGLTPDRWPSRTASSIAAVGFGLTAYGVGADHGWITREQAAERTLATLRFFGDSSQSLDPREASGHNGFYYHFLQYESGRRWRNCELSSIDTALLMLGVLYAGEYFDADTPAEAEIRELSRKLYERVEWDWMQPRPPLVAMGWRPERGGFGQADYRGYNEAMFLYVLAIGSPTHAIDPAAWDRFCSEYTWADFYGYEHVNFGPLFGHQYTACWIDTRGLADAYLRQKGIDYFENSRRATLAQREYAIDNPNGWRGYGPEAWGLTACDGPGAGMQEHHTPDGRQETRRFQSYWARGASAKEMRDDGTIAPTAAGGSIPFAPEETLSALGAMRTRYGPLLYRKYGFVDSFNPSFRDPAVSLRHGKVDPEAGWFNDDYLGIDQGPILLMAENHTTGGVWEVMRGCEPIRRGLRRAGFTAEWLTEE